MAGIISIGDEESQFTTRVQPFSSTPRTDERKFEDDKRKPTASAFSKCLGLEELFSLEVWRASVAELLGSATLVFAIDTIVISTYESETEMPNLIMAVLIGIAITILLLATFPISGGHNNPVITFSSMLIGHTTISRAFVYMLAQFAGGILGAFALKAVVGSSIEHAFSLGGCTVTVIAPSPNGPVTVGLETSPALWLEIICTFIFLFASIWIAFDKRQAKALGAVTVCSIIGVVAGILVFVSTSVTTKKGYAGVGMNPARCLGPAIVRGGHLWDGHWVFWVGPVIACVAFSLYTKIIPRRHFQS